MKRDRRIHFTALYWVDYTYILREGEPFDDVSLDRLAGEVTVNLDIPNNFPGHLESAEETAKLYDTMEDSREGDDDDN
jgi:hypothetical protein